MKLFDEIMHLYNDFISWSKTVEHVNDWETGYPNWMQIKNIFEQFINSIKYEDLNDEVMTVLLYLIGQDNEREYLAELLLEHPNILIQLAKNGVDYPDRYSMAACILCRQIICYSSRS